MSPAGSPAAKRTAPAPAGGQPVQPVTRVAVTLVSADEPTREHLGGESAGPHLMSVRNFVAGHMIKVKEKVFQVRDVVHDVEQPTGITLLVSIWRVHWDPQMGGGW